MHKIQWKKVAPFAVLFVIAVFSFFYFFIRTGSIHLGGFCPATKNEEEDFLVNYANNPVFTAQSALVQDFPQIPVYPDAILLVSHADPTESDKFLANKFDATWETSELVPSVSVWYMRELQRSGWKLDFPPADPKATDIQLVTFVSPTYVLQMSFLKDKDASKTKIVAEFQQFVPDHLELGEEEEEEE